MEEIDADTGNIFEKVDAWIDGFFTLLPNIAVGIIVLLIFIALGVFVGRTVAHGKKARPR